MDENLALVAQVEKSLWRSPTDEEGILQLFSETDRPLASVLIGGFVSMQKQMSEIKSLITTIASNKTNSVTPTELGMFFSMDAYKYLIEDFSLIGDKVAYRGEICGQSDSVILQLSIRLEDFFGSKDVHFANLFKGLRRALTKRDNVHQDYKLLLQNELDEYFSQHKKAKRVKFKVIADIFSELPDVTEQKLKVWLEELGYNPKPDVNRVLWYTNK
jgi:hypothetical protein